VAQNPIQILTATASAGAGENVTWYDAASGGNLVTDPSWSQVGSITYYAETQFGDCISMQRTAVTLTLTATCNDGIQNGDETGIDCGGSLCLPCVPETILKEGYFETGWDGWIDGGEDCRRQRGNRAYEGFYSIQLRANSGIESSMILENVDIDEFATVGIEFHFFASNFENGEDFFLEYSDGGAYQVVGQYVKGEDFENNQFYDIWVLMDRGTFDFGSAVSWRFRCSASNESDQVHIDQVIIIGNPERNGILSNGPQLQIQESLSLSPNPAQKYINVQTTLGGEIQYTIYNTLGQTISKGIFNGQEIPVYDLANGVYFFEISDGDQRLYKNFVKK
jgi:hypothetical protein